MYIECNMNVKNLLLQNHRANFNFQVCTNEGPRPFPREDNYEIAKIH